MKYPLKNMIVPYFKRKQGKVLDEMLRFDLKDLSKEERQEKIDEVVKKLKESYENFKQTPIDTKKSYMLSIEPDQILNTIINEMYIYSLNGILSHENNNNEIKQN